MLHQSVKFDVADYHEYMFVSGRLQCEQEMTPTVLRPLRTHVIKKQKKHTFGKTTKLLKP